MARYPGHVLMMDITEIPGLFRIMRLKLILAIDVFSRFPLSAKVTRGEPSAEAVVVVFQGSVERYGAFRHLVTDQGAQFTAAAFDDAVKAVGTKQRLGAVGHVGSIARIERLWRSLKGLVRTRAHPPLAALLLLAVPLRVRLVVAPCQRRPVLAEIRHRTCGLGY